MKVILTFEFDNEAELQEWEEENCEGGSLYDWLFAEICQNQGFGFLTGIERLKS